MQNQLKIPILKTIGDSANATGISKYQVRQLVLNNKIKYIRSGVKYLVNLESLIDYLNGENGKKERKE